MCIQLYRANTKMQRDTKNSQVSLGDLIMSQRLKIVPRRGLHICKSERCSGLSAPGWMCCPIKLSTGTDNPHWQSERASGSGAREQLRMSRAEDHVNYLNPLLVRACKFSVGTLVRSSAGSSAWTEKTEITAATAFYTSTLCYLGNLLVRFT